MTKSPLAQMKERFTDKAGLLKAVKGLASGDLWIDRANADKGLAHVSNAKLLKLHATLTAVKKEFGSRAALIEAILTAEHRSKDEGYKGRLERFPTPRLLDAQRAAAKREKAAPKVEPKPAKAPVARKPRVVKDVVKKEPVAVKAPAAAKPAAAKAPATRVVAKKAPAKAPAKKAPTTKAVAKKAPAKKAPAKKAPAKKAPAKKPAKKA